MSKNRGVVYMGPGKVEVQDIADPHFAAPDGRRIEHGGGQALFTLMEEAVAHDELALRLCHHPAGTVGGEGLLGQHEGRRNGGREAIHTLYPFRRGRGACSRRQKAPFSRVHTRPP